MDSQRALIENLLRTWKQTKTEPVCTYIHDLDHLHKHVGAIVGSLPSACHLYYAMKANPAAPMLATIAPLVQGIEVASLGEIEQVRAVGAEIPIIFGGPGKTDHEIAEAITQNVSLIHAESLHEIQRIALISQRLGRTVSVLARVNQHQHLSPALPTNGATQFGIDEAELPAAMALIQATPTLHLEGFHIHALINNLDVEHHVAWVTHAINQARIWADQAGFPLRVINVGGGIGVNYRDLDQQFDWKRFAERLHEVCAELLPPGTSLLLEAGRSLTAACGFYAVEVLDIKHNHGRHFVIVRGGSHQFRLPISWNHDHPFAIVPIEDWPYPFARPEVRDGMVSVVGQLCTPKDVLVKEMPIAHLRTGDILLFHYAGAYGLTTSHHEFLSHPQPTQIFLD